MTNREAHEEAAGMNLENSFFLRNDIDPNAEANMNIDELRKQFEQEFHRRHFCIDRNKYNEYRTPGTFQAWCAYKLCASLNGVLPKDYDIYSEDAK